MEKLTSLLKKKRSKNDVLTPSGLQRKASSTMSGSSVETLPLSLSLPAAATNVSSDPQVSFSLMDDIMGELAGSTPKKTALNDVERAIELSRQLDLGQSVTTNSHTKSRSRSSNIPNINHLGKRHSPSKFTDPMSSQDDRNHNSGLGSKPITTAATSTKQHLRGGRVQVKGAEEKAEAASRLGETSKRENAQLPSDDEGCDNSDSEGSDAELSSYKKRQLALRMQQQQQQQLPLLQQQQQQQQQKPQQEQPSSSAISPSYDANSKKNPLNPENVIDRMKDRHRAVIAGAAAAARDEYYEDYMGEHGMLQPVAFNMQYGMDSGMTYGADDYHLQQQQQYFGQGISTHLPHSQVNASYGHPPANTLALGHSHGIVAPVPSYNSGLQGMVKQSQDGYSGHITTLPQEQSYPTSTGTDASASKMNSGEPATSSHRGRIRQQSTASSVGSSEYSWSEPCPAHNTSSRKEIRRESGYGSTNDQGKRPSTSGSLSASDGEKTPTKLSDITKAVEGLSVVQANVDNNKDDEEEEEDWTKSSNLFADDDEDEVHPQPCKDSGVIQDSIHGLKNNGYIPFGGPRGLDNGDDSDDDERPIFKNRTNNIRNELLRRRVALNTPPLAEVSLESLEESMMHSMNGQISFIPNTANLHQPLSRPSSMNIQAPFLPQLQQKHQQKNQHMSKGSLSYQLPTSQPASQMGHQHSYSVDGIPVNMLAGATARRVPVFPQSGYKDLRQSVISPSSSRSRSRHASHSSISSVSIQSPYPMPATTLLHPLPRRPQSAHQRPHNNGSNIKRVDSPSRQRHQQHQSRPSLRGCASFEYVRHPNGGYQVAASSDSNGGGPFIRGFAEPPSSPHQHQQALPQQGYMPSMQQHQKMMGPLPAHSHVDMQQPQAYYMAPSHVGFPLQANDPYTGISSQPMAQAIRR
ncbi:hypothetical protein BG011_005888 [Mortierella polycephala]|uniref:Uncharacterized protein n=1 Tax=Mortierella polycephala TaxID=41804 RepID=A0A9P6PW16_9FUNG|nr:hypothetical protein BG011_005888 [Mortierella polycephala]